jgi:hypothetical protein
MTDKLIGTKPNQVPSNSDLGDLAYQNADFPMMNNLRLTGSMIIGDESTVSGGSSLGRSLTVPNGSSGDLFLFGPSPEIGFLDANADRSSAIAGNDGAIQFSSYSGANSSSVNAIIDGTAKATSPSDLIMQLTRITRDANGDYSSGGDLQLTGSAGIGITSFSGYGARLNVKMSGGSTNAIIASINSTTSGTRRHIDFFDGSSTSRKGAIETNGTSTTYSTTSDRRLKDNIQPITDATIKLMSMKPVTHTWISSPDEPKVHGFIAQEMQEIVPEAVSGDADSEEMMSMDYGRITPVLVAALQEAHKKISDLEERLNDAGL